MPVIEDNYFSVASGREAGMGNEIMNADGTNQARLTYHGADHAKPGDGDSHILLPHNRTAP